MGCSVGKTDKFTYTTKGVLEFQEPTVNLKEC